MRRSKRRKLASLDAMDVATRFVNAANQHDSDGLIACVHRDFQSIQPVHPDRNFRGVAQLRNNWEAIFRSEPGFRLTVLRSTATDDTVWMELHGAGDDEEAAGTFILGVEDGRIRWVRVYSDLVEPATEPPAVAPLSAVPDDLPTTDGAGDEATTDTPEDAADLADQASEWGPGTPDVADTDVEADETAEPDDAAGSAKPAEADDTAVAEDAAVAADIVGAADGNDIVGAADGNDIVGAADGNDIVGAADDNDIADDTDLVERADDEAGTEPAPRRSRFRLLRGKAKA